MDFLSVIERTLKAVRYGIFQASDNLAMLLDGFCRAPESEVYPRYEMTAPGSFVIPDSAAAPQVAVVAPSPKQGSDSGPADSDILTSPAGPHPNPANDGLRAISDMCGVPYSVIADCLREIADDLDPPSK